MTIPSPAPTGTSASLPADPLFSAQWHLSSSSLYNINVQPVWRDYTGRGVKVVVCDEPVQLDHPDLLANIDPFLCYDARSGETGSISPVDEENHGTAVAGLIAAARNSLGGVGVAYNARLGAVSFDDPRDSFTRATELGAHIVNNSWSSSLFFFDDIYGDRFGDDSMAEVMASAVAAGRNGLGLVMVFAAGNEREEGLDSNCFSLNSSPYGINVAALAESGKIAHYSNPGSSILITGPAGEGWEGDAGLTTTDRTGEDGYADGDHVTGSNQDDWGFNGTSAATPVISGVAALMLEANPGLGYRDVQEILAYSARQVDGGNSGWATNHAHDANGGGLHTSRDYGFGYVDALAAVRLAETWQAQGTDDNLETVRVDSGVVNRTVPDGVTTGLSRSLATTRNLTLDHVTARVHLKAAAGEQLALDQLVIQLISPGGTVSTLLKRTGADPEAADFAWTFDSTQFWGESSQGTWTLKVSDRAAGKTATLADFSLTFRGDTASRDDTYIYTNDYALYTGAANAGRRLLADGSGTDTINAAAIGWDTVLDLNPGAANRLAGNTLTVAAGTVIEKACTGDGNDRLTGNSAPNFLAGGRGRDTLTGGAGADTLVGGKGNDTYEVTNGDDLIVETSRLATEVDTVRSSVSYTLGRTYVERLELAGIDDIDGTGNGLNNVLVGNNGANVLDGGSGADTLMGGWGSDTYIVDNPGDVVVDTSIVFFNDDTVRSSIDWLLPAYVENLVLTGTAINGMGNDLDNTLTGNAGANKLNGGLGADTMIGGAGNDSYVVEDRDDAVVETSTLAGEKDTVQSFISYTLGANVENLVLVGNAVRGWGNALDNVLTGNWESNVLDGRRGADTLMGGEGNDVYVVNSSNDVVVEKPYRPDEFGGPNQDTVKASISWTLGANLENLILTGTTAIRGTGNELDNTITGNGAANVLAGGAGQDQLDGGLGADTLIGGADGDIYVVDAAGDRVIETATAAGEEDTVVASLSWTLGANLEYLILTGSAGIAGTGNGLDNALRGNDGNNVLAGGGGNDTLDGGLGADTLRGGAGTDWFMFASARDGVDTLADFTRGMDKIVLDSAAFRALGVAGTATGTALPAGAFHLGAAAAHGEDRLLYDRSTGVLAYDGDGSGSGAPVRIAIVGAGSSHPALGAGDFLVA